MNLQPLKNLMSKHHMRPLQTQHEGEEAANFPLRNDGMSGEGEGVGEGRPEQER